MAKARSSTARRTTRRRLRASAFGCALALVLTGSGALACTAPTSLADRDDSLAEIGEACATETRFREGGTDWTIHTFDSGRRGPLFVVPHDDEDAAFATAAYGLGRHGGTATVVETGGRRFAGGIDPNRNFHGGRLACRGPKAPRFVEAMLGPRRDPVIALHSNARGSAKSGGSGTISILAPYAGAEAFPSPAAVGRLSSEDAMVILAARNGTGERWVRRLTERLNAAGVHVMVETVDLARTDCSLSHYAVAHGRRYANVEVPDGDAATQRRILDILVPLM